MDEGMRGIARILLMGKVMRLTKRRVLSSPSVAKEQRQNQSQQGFRGVMRFAEQKLIRKHIIILVIFSRSN